MSPPRVSTTQLATAAGIIAAVAEVLSDPNVWRHPLVLIQAIAIAILGFLTRGI